jgi:acyl carrier protein
MPVVLTNRGVLGRAAGGEVRDLTVSWLGERTSMLSPNLEITWRRTGVLMTASTDTRQRVTAFLVGEYLFGDSAQLPDSSSSLVESGIIDSTGIIELVEFLQSEFGVELRPGDISPENLETVDRIVGFVNGRLTAPSWS